MKENELMVGDWVYGCTDPYSPDEEQKKFPVKVIRIDIDGDIYTMGKSPSDDPYDYEWWNIEPIPITPEILEKNGFKKLGFDGWEFDYVTEGGCLIYEVLWRCDYPKEYHTHLTIKSYSPDFGSFKSFRIDSVHELQHALRICGIKKEIKI